MLKLFGKKENVNMLKYSNRRIIELQDWDNLVIETYNKPYSFQQQDGCKSRGTYDFELPNKWGIVDYENNTVPEVINGNDMGVSFKAWLERDPEEWNGKEDDKRFLDLFWDRNFYPDVSMIINDLYKKGLIEEGEYSINIDW